MLSLTTNIEQRTMISNNPSTASPARPLQMLEPVNPRGAEAINRQAGGQDNSNVSKIVPLTTFGTIDLGGKKISGLLFSRFCAEIEIFFQQNPALRIVQSVAWSINSGLTDSTSC
jgi:hypothetical protein